MATPASKPKFSIWTWTGIGVLLVLFAVFLAHAVWGAKAKARLDRQIAALIAAGEPMSIDDFSEVPLPDERNIVVLIRNAAAAEVQSQERSQREMDLRDADPYAFLQPLTDAEAGFLREQVGANGAALDLLRGADQTAGAFWNDVPTAGGFNSAYMSELSSIRGMANLLADHARLAIHERRGADVIADIADIHAVGKSMYGRPGVLASLVGTGIHVLAADVAQDASATLALDGPAGARRADVEALVRTLLDDAYATSNLRIGLQSERVMLRDALIGVISPPAKGAPVVKLNGFVRYATTPVMYSNMSTILDVFAEGLKLVDQPSQKAFVDASGPLKTKLASVRESKVNLVAGLYAPSIERYVDTNNRLKTGRHLAATALAIRLYAIDHDEALPPSLDALVPKYLPAVPSDAMDGAALRYDRSRAILWSVGADLKDNGGDAAMPRSNQNYSKWYANDAVVPLASWARPKPAAADSSAGDESGAQSQPASTQP